MQFPNRKLLIRTTHFDPPKIIDPLEGEDVETPGEKGIPSRGPKEHSNLLEELLTQWGVGENEKKAISQCSCIEDILDLDIDDEIKERVLRWHRPTNIEEIIEEPVFELPSIEHMEAYLNGTLKGFLLKLDPDQEKVARKNLQGPTLVKGGPGTGKSLVALYRIRNLMEPEAHKNLFGDKPPRILFVTYTTTLIRASEQLLAPLLGETMKNVEVNNIDKIIRNLIGRAGLKFNPATEKQKLDTLKETLSNFQTENPENLLLEKLQSRVSHDYLISEFDWVIEGRQIQKMEEYLEEDRSGRGLPFDKALRKLVWEIHVCYLKNLEKADHMTWEQLRSKALESVLDGTVETEKYDVVIVDEAQDLTPVGLRLCMALCNNPQGFYMTADSGQSIYNRGFSWKRVDATINVRGRTTILKYNYRCTRQIMEASIQPLRDHGGGDPETCDLIPVLEGPKPLLHACDGIEEQADQAVRFLIKSAKELRLPVTAGAVFVRSNKCGAEFAKALSERSVPAELIKGKDFDLDRKVVKVMTIHSAKGLEFPFAATVRVDSNQIPVLWNIKDSEEKEARLADERRLLTVALSRAMRRLALFYNRRRPSHFINEIDQTLWNCRTA